MDYKTCTTCYFCQMITKEFATFCKPSCKSFIFYEIKHLKITYMRIVNFCFCKAENAPIVLFATMLNISMVLTRSNKII